MTCKVFGVMFITPTPKAVMFICLVCTDVHVCNGRFVALAKYFMSHWTDFNETLKVYIWCTLITDTGLKSASFKMVATAQQT